jgi:hypothetical protein
MRRTQTQTLEDFLGIHVAAVPASGAVNELAQAQRAVQAAEGFDPTDTEDARERILTAIVRRRGQPQFRDALLRAYGRRCAATDYDAVDALEAAHILPYRGEHTNHVSNGLLLRADVHTLFDLGLIVVDAPTMTIEVAPSLIGTQYAGLAGRPLRLPPDPSQRPSAQALGLQRVMAMERWGRM